jgi:lipoprotein signal peptidase
MDVSTAQERDAAPHMVEPALIHVASHVRFWLVSCVILWLDLWSKAWVFRNLETTEVRPAIPGFIDFRRSLNDGAVFGLFSGYTSVFIIASVFALLLMFYLFAHSDRRQRVLHVALGLILAGALGNLYDRAFITADVVRPTEAGQPPHIGRIVSDPDDPVIRIGDYPNGENARSFARATVTVRRQGVVRDFIKFTPQFPAWVPKLAGQEMWPWVFNVADAGLVCGVILLLLVTLFDRRHRA